MRQKKLAKREPVGKGYTLDLDEMILDQTKNNNNKQQQEQQLPGKMECLIRKLMQKT